MKTLLISVVASLVFALSASVTLPKIPYHNTSPSLSAHGYSNEDEIDLHLYGIAEEESDAIFC